MAVEIHNSVKDFNMLLLLLLLKHVPVLVNTGASTGTSAGASAGFSSPASTESVVGFGDKFKKPEDAWDCDVCLVQNKAADVQCVACQAAKPGANVEPKGNRRDVNNKWL